MKPSKDATAVARGSLGPIPSALAQPANSLGTAKPEGPPRRSQLPVQVVGQEASSAAPAASLVAAAAEGRPEPLPGQQPQLSRQPEQKQQSQEQGNGSPAEAPCCAEATSRKGLPSPQLGVRPAAGRRETVPPLSAAVHGKPSSLASSPHQRATSEDPPTPDLFSEGWARQVRL